MGGFGDAGAERCDTTTLAALVLASAGVRVAKQGNRSTAGRVGSADLLQALGVRIALPLPDLLDCLRHTGFAFLDVHRHHPTLKHVLGPRHPLGVRAVCDQLASLANPASATHPLQGVDAAESAPILAEAFLQLGCKAALVVHGEDGVAPISPTEPTTVVELRQGRLDRFTWQPEDAGLKRRRLQELTGGDLHWSRQIARGVLQAEPGAYFDAVALNAGAALYGAGASKDLWTGTQDARLLLQSGQVRRKLDEIVAFTQPRSTWESA